MGTPLPPNEPGTPCLTCWGAGKTFGIATTPKLIRVQLAGLLPADNWDPALEQLLLTPHLLEQAPPAFPCNFGIQDEHFAWSLAWTPIATGFSVLHLVTASHAFQASLPSICEISFVSELIQPIANFAMFGTANLTWSLAGL